MAISLFLGVAIGMIFVWTVLSLASMKIQEWVSARLKWRSRIDLLDAAADKLALNARKYPVDKAHGNALKYSDFKND